MLFSINYIKRFAVQWRSLHHPISKSAVCDFKQIFHIQIERNKCAFYTISNVISTKKTCRCRYLSSKLIKSYVFLWLSCIFVSDKKKHAVWIKKCVIDLNHLASFYPKSKNVKNITKIWINHQLFILSILSQGFSKVSVWEIGFHELCFILKKVLEEN